jgi:hypothetical protein
MKKVVRGLAAAAFIAFVGVSLFGSTPAEADEAFPSDCHLEGINLGLDSTIAQIKSSPAAGHAGGHYGRALLDIEAVRKQLHEGCRVWNRERDRRR